MNTWDKHELLRRVREKSRGAGRVAGARSSAGTIVITTSVGGVCAEVLALAQIMGQEPNAEVEAVVAMNGGRIVAPCGSCRQALYEHSPALSVIVASEKVVTARDLLPYADAPATEPEEPLAMPSLPEVSERTRSIWDEFNAAREELFGSTSLFSGSGTDDDTPGYSAAALGEEGHSHRHGLRTYGSAGITGGAASEADIASASTTTWSTSTYDRAAFESGPVTERWGWGTSWAK